MIVFKCPNCRTRIETSDALAGKEDTCPQCEKKCSVPRQSELPVDAGAFMIRLFLMFCVGANRFWRKIWHWLSSIIKRLGSSVGQKTKGARTEPASSRKEGGLLQALNNPILGGKPAGPAKVSQARNRAGAPSVSAANSGRKQCPKCKEWIDKEATKCPHCRSQQPAPAWATVIAAILMVGLGIWGYRSCSSTFSLSPETEARLDAERQKEEQYGSKSMAWIMAQNFVKKQLVSPGSADFGGMFQQSYEDCVTDLGQGRYSVRGWVDSQNKFGAKLRSNFTCTLKYVGNDNWRCESIDIAGR